MTLVITKDDRGVSGLGPVRVVVEGHPFLLDFQVAGPGRNEPTIPRPFVGHPQWDDPQDRASKARPYVSIVPLGQAPRSKYDVGGGVNLWLVRPVVLWGIVRENFRLAGSSPGWGSPDRMMTPNQWAEFGKAAIEVAQWAGQQVADLPPVVHPDLLMHLANSRKRAESALSVYQRMEREYLAAADAVAQAQLETTNWYAQQGQSPPEALVFA